MGNKTHLNWRALNQRVNRHVVLSCQIQDVLFIIIIIILQL